MEWNEYEANYDEIPKELIVLVEEKNNCIISTCEKNWEEASVNLLGYVDATSDELIKNKGTLIWPVNNEKDRFDRFKSQTIYRIKARQWTGEGPTTEELFDFHSENEFCVVEVLLEEEREPRLEEILAEYRKPVIVKDEVLGTLTLNKKSRCYEGQLQWKNTTIELTLEVNDFNKASCTRVRNAMKKMAQKLDYWEEEMKAYAARELLGLAKEWQEEDREEIRPQDISNKIAIQHINMTASGCFMVYFDDNELFMGHTIIVSGSMKSGVKAAEIAG